MEEEICMEWENVMNKYTRKEANKHRNTWEMGKETCTEGKKAIRKETNKEWAEICIERKNGINTCIRKEGKKERTCVEIVRWRTT